MYREDLTLIEQISVLDKLKAQSQNTKVIMYMNLSFKKSVYRDSHRLPLYVSPLSGFY